MSFRERPELSVVVPVYNEAENIAPFLDQMARQQDIKIEVIISDGGSRDGSIATITSSLHQLPFQVTVVQGDKGRGRQLNLGAGAAGAATLLFLHIDSSFPDPYSLRNGLDSLGAASRSARGRVAGHFALEFDLPAAPPLPYRYYAAKATLDRSGCTHGDQGLMISAAFFAELGGFDPPLPLMEDTFFAERVRQHGKWLLLPASIRTSPRRFVTEGLLPRQTLNAILMNLANIGRLDLIDALRESYRTQDAAQRLRLAPFFSVLRREIAALPSAERRRLWYQTGRYVRSNSWQIAFWLDVVMGKVKKGEGGRFLSVHDRLVGRLIDNPAGNWVTALLVWGWFRLALRASQRELAGEKP